MTKDKKKYIIQASQKQAVTHDARELAEFNEMFPDGITYADKAVAAQRAKLMSVNVKYTVNSG